MLHSVQIYDVLRKRLKTSLGQKKIHFAWFLTINFILSYLLGVISIWINQILVLSHYFFLGGGLFITKFSSPVSSYSNNSQEERAMRQSNDENTEFKIWAFIP